MRIGRYVLAFALLIGTLIIFGNRGLVDNYVIRERLHSLKKFNQEMSNENIELQKTAHLLRTDLAYVEMVARNDLEMVKKGDLVYRNAK